MDLINGPSGGTMSTPPLNNVLIPPNSIWLSLYSLHSKQFENRTECTFKILVFVK